MNSVAATVTTSPSIERFSKGPRHKWPSRGTRGLKIQEFGLDSQFTCPPTVRLHLACPLHGSSATSAVATSTTSPSIERFRKRSTTQAAFQRHTRPEETGIRVTEPIYMPTNSSASLGVISAVATLTTSPSTRRCGKVSITQAAFQTHPCPEGHEFGFRGRFALPSRVRLHLA